jgi:hypothetical protein
MGVGVPPTDTDHGAEYRLQIGRSHLKRTGHVMKLKTRLDRFYPEKIDGRKLNVQIRYTTHDMKREAIPEGAQYSVIEKILSIVEED